MFKKTICSMVFVAAGLMSGSAFADVVINGTRIIYNAKDKESVVQLKNNGKNPYLLQLWMDDGDAKAKPGQSKVPFIITPPVIRIDPNKGQAIRIMAANPALPQDRETLYWFNMLEVPPKPTAMIQSGSNLIQLAFRTRIKFFYRPENLPQTPLEAYRNISFELRGNTLNVKNSSPYFITFSSIDVRNAKDSPIIASVEKFSRRMIEPKGELSLQLTKKRADSLYGLTLFYSVINDFGGNTTNEQMLRSP